jgi:molybdopterin-guanine dinucleotide biosynthesis protein A
VEAFDAIVLAGGPARRLGGADKAAVVLGDESLLSRALHAVAAAERVIVVGPGRDRSAVAGDDGRTLTTYEDPPGGGPVAAVAAGLPLVGHELVVVLACDMPFVGPATIAQLAAGIGVEDAAMLVDGSGRRQFLAAAYRKPALEAAMATLPAVHGASMWALTKSLTVAEVPTDPETTLDCDTWDDIERSRQLLEER